MENNTGLGQARLMPTAPGPEHMATDNIYAELSPQAPPCFIATRNINPDTQQVTNGTAVTELRSSHNGIGHLYPNLCMPVEPRGPPMYLPQRPQMPLPYPIPMPRAAVVGEPSTSSGFHGGPQMQEPQQADQHDVTVVLWPPSHPQLAAKGTPPPIKPVTVPSATVTATTTSASALLSTCKPRSRSRKRCRVPDPSITCFCFISLLIFVVGCATLILGAMAFFGEEKLATLVQMDSSGKLQALNVLGLLQSSSVFLVVVGAAVLFLGFLGCCGVMMQSVVMVAAFGFLVTTLIVTQMTLGTLAWVYRDTAQDNLKQALVTSIKLNYDGQVNTSNAISQAIDFVQVALGCCGVQGPRDFNNTPWFRQYRPRNDSTVPRTCCKLHDGSDHQQQQPPSNSRQPSPAYLSSLALPLPLKLANESCPYTAPGPGNPNTATPCLAVVREMVTRHLAILLSLAVALVLVEVASVCSACNVLTTMRANHRKKKAALRRMASKRNRQ